MSDRKDLYRYDYSGSCAPGEGEHITGGQHTFSVGIFQWIPKSSGVGLKKSAVVTRIKGYTSNPEDVYKRAEEACDRLDRQYWNVKKQLDTNKGE